MAKIPSVTSSSKTFESPISEEEGDTLSHKQKSERVFVAKKRNFSELDSHNLQEES